MFRLCNISKDGLYNNLNWEITAGQRWVLIGSSGAGKTTLSRIMTGLDSDYSGKVLWNGTECNELSSLWGVQFQSSALFHDCTVFENIIFPLKYLKIYSDEFLKDMGMYFAYQIGLNPELLHRYPHQLSGGQKRLVALARALIKNPPMLLLDEPTAGLDPATAERYDNVVSNLTKQIAVVVITHDLERIEKSNNIAYLSKGELTYPMKSEIHVKLWAK